MTPGRGIRAGARAAAWALALAVLLWPGPPPAAQEEPSAPDLSKVTFKPPDERLWVVGTHEGNPQAMLLQFVAQGETMDDWTALVTMQAFTLGEGGQFPDAEQAARMLEERMRVRCPQVEWSELSRTAWSVTYRWRTRGCANQPDESEVARVIVSPTRTLRIAYTARPGPLSAADHERLARWLASFTPASP